MSPEAVPPSPASPNDQAFLQILAHRTMLKAYIFAIVRDPHLAEDTLSDVTLTIVRAWERFDASLPFAPWARGIARRVALANLRKQARVGVELTDEALDCLESAFDVFGSEGDEDIQRQKLRTCIMQLPEQSRRLVQMRYFEGRSYDEIVRLTGRTITALYMAFSRIHEALARCVRSKLFPA